jgi:hypothetical protein
MKMSSFRIFFSIYYFRLTMESQSYMELGGGNGFPVEIDGTCIGPKPPKMHQD